MLKLLRQPTLRRFFIAHGQSQLGTGAGYVALVLISYQRLHSSWAIALVLLADFLPGIGLSAYFGALADRLSRRRLAIAAELIRAAAFTALALSGSFAATVGFALLAGVGTALFRPAVNAALPNLVAPEERSKATALYGALLSTGFTLGPALCGLLLLLLGSAEFVLLTNGATFIVSAALLARVPLDTARPTQREGTGDSSSRSSARDGLRYAVRERRVGAVVLIGAMTALCGAVINVAEPLLATGPLHAGRSGFSILVAAYGLGLVAGSAYTARLGSGIAGLRAHFLAGIVLSGFSLLACGTAATLLWALVPFALAGFANALMFGPEIRLLQELAAERLRGRVFGLRDCVQNTCFALAFIAAGTMLSLAGPKTVYAVAGVSMLATGALGAWILRTPAKGSVLQPAAEAA
jgi:MFS family permease